MNNVLREPVALPSYSRLIHTSWFHIGYVTKNAARIDPYRATVAELKLMLLVAFNSFSAEFAVDGMSYLFI